MFLLSHSTAGSFASGVVRPASFHEAWAETTVQADHHTIRLSPLYSRLVIETTQESGTRPVFLLGFGCSQSIWRQKRKEDIEKFIKELCVQADVFEEFGFCHLEMQRARLSFGCSVSSAGLIHLRCCVHLRKIMFSYHALNQRQPFTCPIPVL